ncbi:MAG: DUF3108 domain-containing protein [Bacteroidales bacterium]|nr:DUF3108 domain-containing protein [Bacteroidales bacterium]
MKTISLPNITESTTERTSGLVLSEPVRVNKAIKFFFIIFLVTVYASSCFSQSSGNNAFQAGEMLRFKGSYYTTSLWADLAEIRIDVSEINSDGKSLYSIKAIASTYSDYDAFFKIRDLYQTWVDKKDIKPYIFKRNVDEGGYKFNMKYVIKRSSLQAKYEYERNGETKTSMIKIQDNTQDFVSVLYYVRTLNFEKMALNKTISIPVLVGEKTNDIVLVYKGKETLKTETFGSKTCYKLGVSIRSEAFVNKESNNVWLTADKNKIPVLVKAEIPAGSVQLRLVEAIGIKN